MKEWLTPSSWLGSWNRDSNDRTAASPAHLNNQRLPGPQEMAGTSSSPPRTSSAFVPRPGALANPYLSNPQALLGGLSSKARPSTMLDSVINSPSASAMGRGFSGPRSTSVESHSGSNMETRLRSLLNVPRSLRSGGVAPGPLTTEENYQEDLDASKDSESSWVAEDNGSVEENMDQQTNESKGQRLGRLRTNHLPPLDLREVDEREEEYTYDLGEGRAEVVQPISHLTPVTKTAEQVILQVENPSTKSPPSPKTSSTDTSRSTLSSSILNRLYTTNPFAMSTPQLSPVHESREEEVSLSLSLSLSLFLFLSPHRSSSHSLIVFAFAGPTTQWCSKATRVRFWCQSVPVPFPIIHVDSGGCR